MSSFNLLKAGLYVQVEKNYVNCYFKGITVYFGAAFGQLELS